jgi:hypothetical protein
MSMNRRLPHGPLTQVQVIFQPRTENQERASKNKSSHKVHKAQGLCQRIDACRKVPWDGAFILRRKDFVTRLFFFRQT